MGEMRLICPGCGAEYQLDAGLIPAQGRDVECSACGKVWRQAGKAATVAAPRQVDPLETVLRKAPQPMPPTAPSAPAPAPEKAAAGPRLNRPLPADVLSILTEEAERERRARAADDAARAQPAEIEWPATTVTAPLKSEAEPPPRQTTPAPVPVEPEPKTTQVASDATRPKLTQKPAEPEPPTRNLPVLAQPRITPEQVAHRRGFRWALVLAAALVAVYLAAPLVPADTQAGAWLAETRASVDQGRIWLAERAAGIITR